MAIAMDALTLNWAEFKAYTNLPWNLIGRVLAQTRLQQAELVLVAPVWKEQGWYHASGDAGGSPLLIPPRRDLITATHKDSLPEVVPQIAMWLRQCYHVCQVSEGAMRQLLASWRQKSSKTYDSLFGKWVSWCCERDIDPISCPIGEITNFLAHLYEESCQYRSINSYRSAISSVHGGYEVGQHPMMLRLVKGLSKRDHLSQGTLKCGTCQK